MRIDVMKHIPKTLKKTLKNQAKSIGNHVHKQAILTENSSKSPDKLGKIVKTRELNKK